MTNVTQGFRISPQQERVWRLQKDSSAYSAQCAILVAGPLDAQVLKRGLEESIRRHEILRAIFPRRAGTAVPIQVIADDSVPDWRSDDLGSLSPREQAARIDDACARERNRGFDFEHGPLLRALLLKLSPEKHLLVATLPSLLSDSRSLQILVQEIAESYAAHLAGREASRQEVVPYLQFSEWQHALLEDEDSKEGRNYWRSRALTGLPALALPGGRGAAPPGAFDPRLCLATFDRELVAEIDAVVRKLDSSAPAFLLACWQSLLWRLSGQSPLVVGTACDGRVYEELGGSVGPFSRWVPLACRFRESSTFREILAYLDEALRDAVEWQEYFVRDAETPVISAGFEFQDRPSSIVAGPVVLSIHGQYACSEPFELRLCCIRTEGSLLVELHYDTRAFEQDEVETLAVRFQALLRSILVDPGAEVAQSEILSRRERERLLVELNRTATAAAPSEHDCLHQLFERQAKRTPDGIAVKLEGQHLSYVELDGRSNQLARHLRKLGTGPDGVVGIYLERSLDMMIALFGVLKAAGAYLPLEPAYPGPRLAFMLEDAKATVVLTKQRLLEGLPRYHGEIVCLDRDWTTIARESRDSITKGVTPENLAYVMYTSGSTGEPKGIMIPHRGLVNYLEWCTKAYRVAEGNGAPVHSPIGFDLTVTGLFSPLLVGQPVTLLPEGQGLECLEAALRGGSGFSLVKLTPVHLEALNRRLPAREAQGSTRALVIGGESLKKESLSFWQAHAPHTRLINEYGPTETVVGCCVYEVPGGDDGGDAVPIGRPIDNTQAYVLDSHLGPVPTSVAGELCIGGAGLARGYVNRPELTAARFIPDPFGAHPGSRLYRTGDRARWLPSGNLEFLGRRDRQVKIRGYRIELDDIEVQLSAHPAVHQTALMAREDPAGGKSLVAYVVPRGKDAPTTTELRAFLASRLPHYMVPGIFVMLEAMPTTANGKVDRKALPSPEGVRPQLKVSFVAPRSLVEEQLAEIWARVLRVQRVGVHDDFFDLGGHSLLATQLISRIREVFEVELPFDELFEHPTIAGLARAIERAGSGEGMAIPPMVRVSRDAELRLSFAQQRLWFLSELMPESPMYNLPLRARLRGNLDVGAFGQTFQEIVQRHETLRTSFATVEGRAIQQIAPSLRLAVPLVDLSSLAERERDAELRRLAAAEAERVFHLSRAPLMRVRLLRLGEGDFVAFLTLHHILADGWSMGVLLRDLAGIYAALSAGTPPSLPELPVQYADYAHWQRLWFQGDRLQEHLAYYRKQLANLPVLDLVWDRPRPALQTFHGSTHYFQWPEDLSTGLEELRRREGVTLFMVLQAAFQLLLFRYSGQTDIVLGSPVANRHRPEIEGLIGFFVNMLVLRGDLSGDPRFRELLGRTRKVCLGAMAHQDLPYEKLVEELEPERDLRRQPLFQIVLALENAPMPAVEVSDALTLELMEADTRTAKFDLGLSFWERPDGLGGCIEYNTDLVDGSTIRRLAAHFETLLRGIVGTPEERLSMLPVLTRAERQQLRLEWNDGAAPSGCRALTCLHEVFAIQTARAPDAVAVVDGDRHLTYGALEVRTNQLAHELRALGVRPDAPVGICLERSLEMVVGILGILKAGGAYVPIDPDYPRERLAFLLADNGNPMVVTRESLVERLPQDGDRAVSLDRDWERIAARPDSNPEVETGPAHLAYVIYTSGSTGRPKGVGVTHQAVIRLVLDTNYVELAPTDRIGQASVPTFDAATFEIWGALLNGACLVLVKKEELVDPRLLAHRLDEQAIDILWVTAALFNQLVRERPSLFATIRCLLFGGEPADPAAVRDVLRAGPPGRLINGYGPTETTTFACWHLVRDVGIEATTIPIGLPISNTSVHLTDPHGNLIPVGVPGELRIGGPGVARGYLGQPGLTGERFVPDAFGAAPGERCYRTGDLCRRRADGSIEFLHRLDQQVKIRGFRIELGEIESVLAEHPSVKQAVVLSREEIPGDKRLVGYLVLDSDGDRVTPDIAPLRSYLKSRLPDYMVPGSLVTLESIPLTPSGKVDRRLLPAPHGDRPELSEGYAEPRTPEEAELARLWAAVLRVERVGIHDNFFELGGHSLLATQIVSRAREAFQMEIPLRQMFESPTIYEMARAMRKVKQALAVPPIEAVDRHQELPLSFAQQRLWFVDQMVPGNPFFNVPFAVRVEGELEVGALGRGLNEILRRHEALRTTFTSRRGAPWQRIASALTLRLAVVDLEGLPETRRESEARRLAQDEAEQPFDLERGPLMRAGVLRLGEREHTVLLTLHHIVADEWSTRVLLQELLTLYEAYREDRRSPLPELPIQYADFAYWQRQWLQGEVLEEQLSYWKEQLADLPILELPVDRPRPAQMTFRGAVHSVELPAGLTASLRELSRDEGMTLFMTLLAGFQILLSRYARQDDIVVGGPIANRNRSEIENLIGFFVNTLVLRADLSGNPSFREVLGRVREVSLGAFAHQEVPFDLLVEKLSPERHLSHTPLFQVAFAMEREVRVGVEPRGLRLTPVELSHRTAKCDLTLFAWEGTEGVACTFEYSTDLFEAPTIARMANNYRMLLERMADDPDSNIDQPLITDEERARLIRQSSETTEPAVDVDVDVEEWSL